MSLFDVIGPVMVGPSSSHTAGANRIGRFARVLFAHPPRRVRIGLHGSFAATGKGHGTHLALLAGILGLEADDERIPQADRLATEAQLDFSIETEELGDVHPNSVRIRLEGDGASLDLCASSVGGGRILVWRVDDFDVELEGDYPTLLLVYQDRPGVVAVVAPVLAVLSLNIATMKVHRTGRGQRALMAIQLDQIPPDSILDALRALPPIEEARFIPGLGLGA